MAPCRSRSLPAVLLLGAGSLLLLARPAFVTPAPGAAAARAPRAGAYAPGSGAAGRAEAGMSPADTPSVAVAVGAWTAAAALASLRRRVASRAEPAQEEKAAFNVWEPSTWGNISMDDVKKYGTAGTVAYVLTELVFWAIAFPTECFVYLQTAGHWPDFNNSTDSATVFGFVFAASNIARVLVPVRFGAALALAPWVDENIMTRLPGASRT